MSQRPTDPAEIRRSARLGLRKTGAGSIPSTSQQPSVAAISGGEGEVIYVSTDGAVLSTRAEASQPGVTFLAPDSVPGRVGGQPYAVQSGMAPSTRLKYKPFRGSGRTDVDDWMGEFESIAFANEETPLSKQRVFQGLLKGEALKWYQDLEVAVREDWDLLIPLFLRTFREAGGEARALGRLSQIYLREGESVRKYGQRLKSLVQKLTDPVANNIQVEWYLAGLPEDMSFQIRQFRPTTLSAVMEAAQNYENAGSSLRASVLKAEKRREKEIAYRRTARRKGKHRDSESDEESTDSDPYDSDSSAEKSLEPVRRGRGLRSEREKTKTKTAKAVTVKEEGETSKLISKLESLNETMEGFRVLMAEERKPRRTAQPFRPNIWCTRCGQPGHNASDCTTYRRVTGKNVTPVQYVSEEDGCYYTFPDEEPEEELQIQVYQVQQPYGRGKPQPNSLVRTTLMPRQAVGTGSQPPRQLPGECFICHSREHYANNCPYRSTGSGAPLILPCQNCGQYGHGLVHCPQAPIQRAVYKQVETLPREQTALNYGHTAGVDKPDK